MRMPSSAASPERESRLHNRLPDGSERQILTAPESKKLKKGMSRGMKVFLATSAALAGTAVVGGVIAKGRFDAMTPEQQLDTANSMIGRTSWAPWLSNRIRGMRDQAVLRQLDNPNAGAGMDTATRLRIANHVITGTADSPAVSAAVRAKRDAAVATQVSAGLNTFSLRASRFLSGLAGGHTGGAGGSASSLSSLTTEVQRTNKLVEDGGLQSAAAPRFPGSAQ